jgi:hypothetical protein
MNLEWGYYDDIDNVELEAYNGKSESYNMYIPPSSF